MNLRIKNNKKGDLAVDLVFILIILIVSIFFLLALFSNRLTGLSKVLYCKTVFHVQSSSFIPPQFRQDPSYCKWVSLTKSVKIQKEEKEVSSFKINNKNFDSITCDPGKVYELNYSINSSDVDEITFRVRKQKEEGVEHINIKTCGKSLLFNISNPISSINLGRQVFKGCKSNLSVHLKADSKIQLYDLSIKYKECEGNNFIVSQLISCWSQFKYGEYPKDEICEELILSEDCPEFQSTEANITSILIKNNLCTVLPNNDSGNCGMRNALIYNVSWIRHKDNYIIKYDAENKRLIVE